MQVLPKKPCSKERRKSRLLRNAIVDEGSA
jgi:hypothetical protein